MGEHAKRAHVLKGETGDRQPHSDSVVHSTTQREETPKRNEFRWATSIGETQGTNRVPIQFRANRNDSTHAAADHQQKCSGSAESRGLKAHVHLLQTPGQLSTNLDLKLPREQRCQSIGGWSAAQPNFVNYRNRKPPIRTLLIETSMWRNVISVFAGTRDPGRGPTRNGCSRGASRLKSWPGKPL